MSQSFPKKHRLLTPESFSVVLKGNAQRVASKYFVILYKENTQNHPRIGLAIAKRLVKTAVGRNRIKRVAREVVRRNSDTLSNIDIVILCREGVGTLDKAALRSAIETTWQRLLKAPL